MTPEHPRVQEPIERSGASSWHRPRCPRCGSSNVRESGAISIGYNVSAISDDGDLENDDLGGDPCYESYVFEHLMCRDCDYQDEDPTVWIPQPDVVLGES
jgi:predicted nucleic-acid-binding Zn-ribbon protein